MASSAARASEVSLYDCGTLALYRLAHIEGFDINLGDLENYLPPPSASGYSLKQLRDAARAFGLGLEGIRSDEKVRAPDCAFIAYLKREPHGHFIVIRPVGTRRRMVQVFDNDHPAEVLDLSDLSRSNEWTGLALRPTRPDWSTRIVIGLTTLVICLRVSILYIRRRSSIRSH